MTYFDQISTNRSSSDQQKSAIWGNRAKISLGFLRAYGERPIAFFFLFLPSVFVISIQIFPHKKIWLFLYNLILDKSIIQEIKILLIKVVGPQWPF